MREFWEYDGAYTFLRRWVDYCTRQSYRRMERIGGPVPNEGAVVYAANHTNTLMDALVVLKDFPEGIAYGARADVFRKPKIARMMHFFKIVPFARRNRERPEEVMHNAQTFEEIDRILAHGLPFCITCEGRHRTKHSLLPIRRGVSKIAFTSAAQRPTTVVPVGIDYSDWFHYRGLARVRYGEPIDINALMEGMDPGISDSDRDMTLQNLLYEKISSLIFFIPDDDGYDEKLAEAEAALKAKTPRHSVRRVFQAILGFPLFLISAALSLPMWGLAEYLCKWAIKDHAFNNTARFGVRLVGTPLWLIIWALVFFLTLSWWLAAVLLLMFIPSYSIFYDYLNLLRGPQEFLGD